MEQALCKGCLVSGERLKRLITSSVGFLIASKNEIIFLDVSNERIRKIVDCYPEYKKLHIFYSNEFSRKEFLEDDKYYCLKFEQGYRLDFIPYPEGNIITVKGTILQL